MDSYICLKEMRLMLKEKKCLVLGNGGTSKTAQAVLEELGAEKLLIVSRNPEGDNTISYEECYNNHYDAQIIVNTTPVGMYPNIDASPLRLNPFYLMLVLLLM